MQNQEREFASADRTNAIIGRSLGVFSVGLGLAELAAPRAIANLIGVDPRGVTIPVLRAFGAREVANGIGLLSRPLAPAGPWARVIGDLIDAAFLGWALTSKSTARRRTIGALAAVAGVMIVDAYAGIRQRRTVLGEPVRRAITIYCSPDDVYETFRRFERLPEFMKWLESVTDLGNGRSRWRVRTGAGRSNTTPSSSRTCRASASHGVRCRVRRSRIAVRSRSFRRPAAAAPR